MKIAIYFLILISLVEPREALADQMDQEARPASEYAQNFGLMYVGQWAFYYVSQKDIIEKHGSFDNWIHHPTEPVFDKDSFDYNIFKHSLAGQYYYLFYRHQGYSEMESFAWTFISSLAFEFTVETVTEKPSYQDIYQTPIYGTIVGMGTERLSNYLLSQDSAALHILGYIFNPFNLLNKNSSDVSTRFNLDKEAPGFLLSWRF
jgi:hypothetical protein